MSDVSDTIHFLGLKKHANLFRKNCFQQHKLGFRQVQIQLRHVRKHFVEKMFQKNNAHVPLLLNAIQQQIKSFYRVSRSSAQLKKHKPTTHKTNAVRTAVSLYM